jgi:hypothetical protein
VVRAVKHGPVSRYAILPILFPFSGASSLICEAIFTRLLSYNFGTTAYARK